MTKTVTYAEVAKHKTEDDLWMVIHGKVYDVTPFKDEHPGGVDTLLDVAGADGTDEFDGVGHSDNAKQMLEKYYVGDLAQGEKPAQGQVSKKAGGPSGLAVAIVMVLLGLVMYLIVKP